MTGASWLSDWNWTKTSTSVMVASPVTLQPCMSLYQRDLETSLLPLTVEHSLLQR